MKKILKRGSPKGTLFLCDDEFYVIFSYYQKLLDSCRIALSVEEFVQLLFSHQMLIKVFTIIVLLGGNQAVKSFDVIFR